MPGRISSFSHDLNDSSGLTLSCRKERGRRNCLKYIGMSVSAIALIIGSAGASRADDVQPMDVITQADGQTGAVTISVPTGQSNVFGSANNDYAGLSKNDYDKLSNAGLITTYNDESHSIYGDRPINANSLNITGGGSVTFGLSLTDFSVKTVQNLNIKDGKVIVEDNNINNGTITPSTINFDDNNNTITNINISKDGVLSIKSYYGSLYTAVNQINGDGKVEILNSLPDGDDGASLRVFGAGSHFSGTIQGVGPAFNMAALPPMNTPLSADIDLPTGSSIYLSSAFVNFDHAIISGIGLLEVTNEDASNENGQAGKGVGNVLFNNGAHADVGEFLIAGGQDGYHFIGGSSDFSSNVQSIIANTVLKDEGTSAHAAQLVVGQQVGVDDASVIGATPGSTLVHDYGASRGNLWISDGASVTISGGGVNGGIYLGNSAGNGPDNREGSNDVNPSFPEGEAHGVIHVTGDQVGYNSSNDVVNSGTVGQSAQLNVQNGGLWIGPVDGGKGSGDIIVDHGGQLNLDNSFAVLGGQNGAGNIAIGQGGTATITGMKPLGLVPENQGLAFNTQRQGAFSVSDGGTLNIGTATSPGLLKVYGDLNLARGSTTTFYEGTTSEKGNKGDAYNSHAEVSGNVTLGGNIQIAGITGQNKGQNGAVDAGIYHLIDYTGTLSGQQQATLVATKTGQTLSYVHDDAAKSVDVMVSQAVTNGAGSTAGATSSSSGTSADKGSAGVVTGHDVTTGGSSGGGTSSVSTGGEAGHNESHAGTDTGHDTTSSAGAGTTGGVTEVQQPAAPTAWSGGSAVLTEQGVSDGKAGSSVAPASFVGQGGTIMVAGTSGQPVQTSSLNFGSDGYTLTGGALAAAATSTGQNMLNVNAETGRSGTIAAPIVDDGSSKTGLMKTGTGTLTLSGRNDYSGATGVQGGTLTVAQNAVISDRSQVSVVQGAALNIAGQVGRIINNGTLAVMGQTGDVSNSGGQASISGTGQVASMTNTGTVLLSDQAKVTGALDQLGGTFKVADNAKAGIGTLTGYGSGYLGKDATLTLTGNNTAYGDALFGQGGLIVQGQNVVFKGTNYYSGGTEIAQGADVTAGAQSLGTNGINLAGTLTIEENGTESFDNPLSGSGTFNKTGIGTLTLDQSVDDSHFEGTTNVRQGELVVNNVLNGSTNVGSGAMISGSGTINNLTLHPWSFLDVTLNGAQGVTSPLTLTGTQNHLNGAEVVATVNNLSSMVLQQHYKTTILRLADAAQASGTLSDIALMDSNDSNARTLLDTAFLKGRVSEAQDGRSWILDYVRMVNFQVYAQDHNESQVGFILDHSTSSAGFVNALAGSNIRTDEQVRGAYNSLSGEINASAKTAMVNDSFYVQEAVVDRLDCAGDALRAHTHDGKQQTSGYCDVDPTRHVSVWGTVYGQKGGQSGGAAGAAHMGQSSVGWIMGADTGLKGGWRLGGLLAYGRDWFGVQSGRGSSAHANSATIGAYAGNAWHVGGLTKNAAITFKGGLSYSWNMLHTNRRVTYGDYAGRLSSNNRTGTGQVFAETGYRMVFASESRLPLEVEPFARMTYLNYNSTNFREHGADSALAVKGQNSSIGFSTMGVKLATSVTIGKVLFSPHVEAGYRRAFGRTNASVREGFSALGGGYGMSVQGTPLSINTAQINTGFAARLTDRIDVNVDYIGQYGGHQTSSGGSGNFSYKF